MKITNSKQKQAELDFDNLVKDLIAQYGTIFFANIDNNFFIYKPLSRKDYKAIVENNELTNRKRRWSLCYDYLMTRRYRLRWYRSWNT